jgi:hypothetical protein
MIFKSLRYDLPVKDEDFDKIYPHYIQKLSPVHWTSIEVARKAANYLVSNSSTKVLDIGSGVGKFCMVGATTTLGNFYGVEQRKDLVTISKKIIEENRLSNVKIIHSSITDIDFCDYNSFYFFNSFYENLDRERIIDFNVKVSPHRYQECRDYMYLQLLKAPIGTKLATYSGFLNDIPSCYSVQRTYFGNELKLWVKEKSFESW